jgi:osmotically-inducible protein OsmY
MVMKRIQWKNSFTLLLLVTLALALASACNNSNRDTPDLYPQFSDDKISKDLTDRLKESEEINAENINVSTLEGIVKLTGTADNLMSKEKAEEIASTIQGVHGVINQLHVETVKIPDAELKERINTLFEFDPAVDVNQLAVNVNNGQVEIVGMVDSWSERELAGYIMKSVEGITSITNRIAVDYKDDRTDQQILGDIVGMLEYDVEIDDEHIDVKVENRKAMLSGQAGSLYEKSKAITNAWVAGVDTVIADQLEIVFAEKDTLQKNMRYTEITDEQIKKAIEKVLSFDARVNSLTIDVNVNDGNVTLKGTVSNLRAKKAAEEDAKNIIGVWGVENLLEVKPVKILPKKTIVDNTEVVLNIHPYLRSYDIAVDETQGTVFLEGNVTSFYEKQLAEDITSGIPGVTDVENNLVIESIQLTRGNK